MNKLLKVSTLGLCLLSGLVTNIIAPNSAFAAEVESEPNKHYVPFQARLHDEDGSELNGIYQLNFKLYDQETTGTTLWTETHENVSVVSGYVNVLLGGINDLKNEATSSSSTIVPIDFSKQRYLGISIGKYVKQGGITSTVLSNELLPRHQLVPSFHAATATDSAKLGGYPAEDWSKKTEMLSAVKVVQDDLDYVRSSSFTTDTRQVEQPDGSFVNETYYIAESAKNADNATTLNNVAASSYLQSADLNVDTELKKALKNNTDRDSLQEALGIYSLRLYFPDATSLHRLNQWGGGWPADWTVEQATDSQGNSIWGRLKVSLPINKVKVGQIRFSTAVVDTDGAKGTPSIKLNWDNSFIISNYDTSNTLRAKDFVDLIIFTSAFGNMGEI